MSADSLALKHGVACLYRNSERCVIAGEYNAVYPVNTTKGHRRILLQVPSSKSTLVLEKHVCGGQDLGEWDNLVIAGNTVVWLTPKKVNGFGVLVNNMLSKEMPGLKMCPSYQISPSYQRKNLRDYLLFNE